MSDKKLSWHIENRDGRSVLVYPHMTRQASAAEVEAWELLKPESETPEKRKPILGLDFDGVIHRYRGGWRGETNIYDGPVSGFFGWLEKATKHFRVVVHSSRCGSEDGRAAIIRWLWDQCPEASGFAVSRLEVWNKKPPAFVTIDDRALTFTGRWEDFSVERLLAFKTWQQEGEKD